MKGDVIMTLLKEPKQEKVEVTVERLRSKVYVVIARKGDITKEAILVVQKKDQMDDLQHRIEMAVLEINNKGIEVTEKQVQDIIKWNATKLHIHFPKKET